MEIPEEHRAHVESRLAEDRIAWLTTVRPSGIPDTVPIWFLWEDPVFVVFSEPGKPKLRNIEQHPQVSLALDDTRGGDDVVRFEATARIDEGHPGAHELPAYVEKYGSRIPSVGYGDAAEFARHYSVPVVITPTRFRRWV